MSVTSTAMAPTVAAPECAQPGLTTRPDHTTSRTLPTQLLRFSVTGILNTAIDVLALNALLLLFDVRSAPQLLLANAAAYSLGAVNSFALNKRWTFGRRNPTSGAEVGKFALTTLLGIAVNDALLWAITQTLQPLLGSTSLLANLAKLGAIGGTVLLSFLGMRLWVFTRRIGSPTISPSSTRALTAPTTTPTLRQPGPRPDTTRVQRLALSKTLAHHGISVVLPAFNEELAIRATLAEITRALDAWGADYEVIVVNDGSRDHTAEVIAAFAASDSHVRVVTHLTNQGYGAAVVSGFGAATKDLTFFMDSDGQFTIDDLPRLLIHVDEVDAVLGYRQRRQDSWMRLLNAWGWKQLVSAVLGVRVRDLDCAYKIFRTDFLRAHAPTTSGALINAELLYALRRIDASYREVGVCHLPRNGGRATGAKPSVVFRAFRDLFVFAWRQRVRGNTRPVTLSANQE